MVIENEYKELLSVIIKSKIRIFGILALKTARAAGGLFIDDDGSVQSITGDPLATMDRLMAAYEKIGGKSSTVFIKITAFEFIKKHPALKLPPSLT